VEAATNQDRIGNLGSVGDCLEQLDDEVSGMMMKQNEIVNREMFPWGRAL